MEQSAVNLNSHTESGIATALQLNEAYDTNRALLQSIKKILTTQEREGGLTQSQLLELFVNLFGQLEHGKLNTSARENESEVDKDSRDSSFDSGNGDHYRNRSEKVTRIDSDSSLEGAVRASKFQTKESVDDENISVLKKEQDAENMHIDNNNRRPPPPARNEKDRAGSESNLMEIGEPLYSNSADIFSAPLMTMNVAKGSDTNGNKVTDSNLPVPVPLPPSSIAPRSQANQMIAPIQARDRLLEALHKLKQVDEESV